MPDQCPDCPRCGIVFVKYGENTGRMTPGTPLGRDQLSESKTGKDSDPRRSVRDLLFGIPESASSAGMFGKIFLWLFLVAWGARFIGAPMETNYAGGSFMHLINLPFHEAGHVIFGFLGRFLGVLGGSLLQVLIPLSCVVGFLATSRDPFGGSVSLWWLGESFMDLAPYINDARELRLVLLGGVTGRDVADYHDWQYLLGQMNLLEHDHTLAACSHRAGGLLMILALVWGGRVIYGHYCVIQERR